MKNLVLDHIKKVINKDLILEKPKDKNLAHYATPLAFSLAKEYKKSPKIIAEELANQFRDDEILEVSVINGYLNFHLKPNLISSLVKDALDKGTDFAKEDKKDGKILLEYVSANPTGPLHVGHIRGAVYGDVLQAISNYLGHQMDTEYYINDAGNQIDLLGISLSLRAREFLYNENVTYPEKYYRGEYLDDIAKLAEKKFGKDIFYDESRNLELANFAKDEVLKIIKKDLSDAGIVIENYVSEKSLYSKLDDTIKTLEKSGYMFKDDKGRILIRSTEAGDDQDRVVIREDGRPTYMAADVVYHNDKFQRGYDECIDIWGADHHGYIARIRASIKFLGHNPDNFEVILMQMVNLLKDGKPYKFSKRAGNVILMSDVLKDLGKDILRFIFISKSGSTPLEFDVEDLKKEDSSNPIFYINYAHARVHQIFAKANKKFDDVKDVDLKDLDQEGLNLAFEALILNDILNDAFSSRSLHKITDYLKNLSASFHKYYNENKVIGSENESAKLKLFAMVALSIKTAFKLIGIEAKNKMSH